MTSILEQHFGSLTLTDSPVSQNVKTSPQPILPVEDIARKWLEQFDHAIASRNAEAIALLFHDDAWWRDTLGLSWDFHTYHTARGIKDVMAAKNTNDLGLSNIAIEPGKPVMALAPSPAIGECIFAFFRFETKLGRGRGIVNLTATDQSGADWKAFTIYTCLQELKGYEERLRGRRPAGVDEGEATNWFDKRKETESMESAEPTVIVIGAGHSGLNIAARLGMLNILTLVVERNPRVGDNWRNRYKSYLPTDARSNSSLVLHDPVWYDHLSYIPFPEHWPVFTPKDKLGDWFEGYAKAMELNVWTSTTIVGQPTFDPKTHKWTITLNRNGEERTFHPRHTVLATGVTGEPRVPHFKGADIFKGDIHHSSKHHGGAPYKGKRAVIVGCCTSGHDIARDFYANGAASVTMIQRNSTYVMSQEHGLRHHLSGIYGEDCLPTDDADLFSQCLPIPIFKVVQQQITKNIAADDKDILSNLAKAGFKLDYGYGGSGLFIKFLLTGGGYYIDVGCSKLIGDGHIKIKQGVQVHEIVPDGIVFEDGSKLEADVIILATGYDNMRETASKIFGKEVGDKVGDVWGLNDEGEIATIWQSTFHLESD